MINDSSVEPGAFRRAARRAEGLFWLTRPQTAFSKVPMAAAGWLIGRGAAPTSPLQAVALVLLLMVLQALLFIINDVIDAEKDRVTAPYMPIPSGLVSRRAAILFGLALGGIFVACVGVLSTDLYDLAIVLATLPLALLTMLIYGRTKSAWFSPLLASTASSSAPLWMWLLAGHQHPAAFAALFGVTTLHGVHANLRAQLRDIEGDPKAGNRTLAVRIGARRTLWLAAGARIVELGGVLAMCLAFGRRSGLWWLLPTTALLIVGLLTAGKVYAENRDRVGQTDALTLWVYISFLTEISILGAFVPLLALPTAVVMVLWFNVVRRGYYSRLVGGRLAAGHGRPGGALAPLKEPVQGL